MNSLSLETINAAAPYKVWLHEETGSYHFISDGGVVFAIDFDDDDLIRSAESYILGINNVNKNKSPRDNKMRDTVFAIVEEFFHKNEAALLYICETGDGKQAMRGRLFTYWFTTYEKKDDYVMMPFSLKEEDGTEDFAALVIRKDNPHFVDVVAEFADTVSMFNLQKP